MRILDQVKEVAPDLDLFTNSGENFHHPYNINDQFRSLLDKWEEITRIVPVATIRATQGKHERPGMVETLKRAGVKILDPGVGYNLEYKEIYKFNSETEMNTSSSLLIFGVPHPHKANMLANNKDGLSRDEANALVNRKMRDLYDYYGAMRANHPNIPALAVGHGVVQGENTRDLHAIKNSAIYSTEADLKRMGCDFYAWGHYHNPTEFELIKGGYLGSFAWDFNELDYKPAITIVDWDTMEVSRHELDINVKRKLVMFPGDEIPDLTGCDVHLVNNKTEWTESDCKEKGAGLVKITTEVEKEHKVRSQEVIEAETYQDKFKAVYPEATERQLKVCEEFWESDKAEGKIPEKKVITPLWVEIYGSKTFSERMGKDKVRFDLQDLEDVTMLVGPGGHGKSSVMDYISPFSVLFLQSNSLLSTFELEDSYIEQEFDINGTVYRIKKHFKPTLANPKAEYYAFDESGPVQGLDSGNRKPYDEWCVKMFGSPRKYAASVINTQFDDNPATFGGQKINPSIFQASNIELKALFHELAGTDMKHLELRCKTKADEFKKQAEDEEIKKAGVEESIPDREILDEEIKEIKSSIAGKASNLGTSEKEVISLKEQVHAIELLEQKNKDIDTEISILNSQKDEEEKKKEELNKSLSELQNVDVESVSKEIEKMDSEKIAYDSRLKELPGIKAENVRLQKKYMSDMEKWNSENLSLSEHNRDVDDLLKRIEEAKTNKSRAESRKTNKINIASRDQEDRNKALKDRFDRDKKTIETAISTIEEQIKTGEEMISNIRACSKCGNIEDEDLKKKSDYQERLDQRKGELEAKKKELSELKEPEPVVVEADTSEEDKEISEAEAVINQTVPEKKTISEKPVEPKYESEEIPTFEMDRYTSLKDQISSYSESKVTELQTKISESTKRIADLQSQIDSKENHEIDYTAVEELKTAEAEVKRIEKEIQDLNNQVSIKESKLADIEKMRESLIEYDKRIEAFNEEFEFWKDMKEKWGPNGIPARILEHTGPYVDQEANNLLAQYYPEYRIHSETTKMSSDGKKELEVFNISVINQTTGRTKPINALSGEERAFVNEAIREAFREVDKQNSLIQWKALFEDEPDAHVSSARLMAFWDMIEHI
jgi:exonuclease SbcC